MRSQAGFTGLLLRDVARLGYERPTAIQMQALPIALSGRDMIGEASPACCKLRILCAHVLNRPG